MNQTFNLKNFPKILIEEDFSNITDIDMEDIDWEACSESNYQCPRISLQLRDSGVIQGILFDNTIVYRIGVGVVNDPMYIEMLHFLASFYKQSVQEVTFTLEDEYSSNDYLRSISWNDVL